MTRDEKRAVKVFKDVIELNDRMTFCINEGSPLYNAAMVAIKTLEQEPCEDAISRKKVDRIIMRWLSHPDYELKDHIYNMTKDIHKLPSVQPTRKPEQKWIPIGERLPEDKSEVLVCDDDGYYFVAMYVCEINEWFSGDEKYDENTPIVAWAPIEPYKVDEEMVE